MGWNLSQTRSWYYDPSFPLLLATYKNNDTITEYLRSFAVTMGTGKGIFKQNDETDINDTVEDDEYSGNGESFTCYGAVTYTDDKNANSITNTNTFIISTQTESEDWYYTNGVYGGKSAKGTQKITLQFNNAIKVEPLQTIYIWLRKLTGSGTVLLINQDDKIYNIDIVNSYSITLNKDDGIDSVTGSGSDKIPGENYTIEATLKTGYVFKNWTGYTTSVDNPYSFTMPTENITFTANTVPTIGITYYSNEATEIKYKNELYTETELNILKSIYQADVFYEDGLLDGDDSNGIFLSKTGYRLTGNWLIGTPSGEPASWSIGGTGEDIAQLTGTTLEDGAKEKSVYAEWEPIPYTITYYLNGGTNPSTAQSEYTIISDTYILPTPTKIGYTFLGWYDNSSFSGNATTQIPKGSYGDKNFYAKWKANGLVQIYIDNEWKKAIPYIYNNDEWQQTIPYIYNGSNWKLCGE